MLFKALSCLPVFPHSLIRRKNGDDITIWVNNNFQEKEAPAEDIELYKRQSARPNTNAYTVQGGQNQRICWGHHIPPEPVLTRPESASTGGAHAMIAWGRNAYGFFKFGPQEAINWSDALLGGSNSGANARFSVKKGTSNETRIGTRDVALLVDYSVTFFQVIFGSGWRVAAEGVTSCPGGGFYWEVKKTDKRIRVDYVYRKRLSRIRGPSDQMGDVPRASMRMGCVSLRCVYPFQIGDVVTVSGSLENCLACSQHLPHCTANCIAAQCPGPRVLTAA